MWGIHALCALLNTASIVKPEAYYDLDELYVGGKRGLNTQLLFTKFQALFAGNVDKEIT